MIFRKAFDADKEEMIKLWEYSFDTDSPQFVEHFFKNIYSKDNAWQICDKETDRILASAQAKSYTFFFRNHEIPTYFFFGIATLAEARGQGSFSLLLDNIFTQLYEEDLPFFFLRPIDYGLYRPFGFGPIQDKYFIKGETRDLHQKDRERFTFEKIEGPDDKKALEDLKNFYDKKVKESYTAYIKRNEKNFKNNLLDLWSENGFAFLIKKDGEVKGSIFYYFDKETLVINEILYEDSSVLKAIFQFIYNHNTQKKYYELRDDFYKVSFLCQSDVRKSKLEIFPFITMRIINLKVFLRFFEDKESLAQLSKDESYRLLFRDKRIKANNLIWTVGSEKAEFSSPDGDWDFAFDIDFFASLAMGWLSPQDALLKLGSNDVKDPEKFLRFASSFFRDEKIFFNEYA